MSPWISGKGVKPLGNGTACAFLRRTRDSFSFLISEKKDQNETKTSQNSIEEIVMPEKLQPLRDVERNYIEYVLRQTNWHKGKTAELLGITRPTLDKRIEEFGLRKDV